MANDLDGEWFCYDEYRSEDALLSYSTYCVMIWCSIIDGLNLVYSDLLIDFLVLLIINCKELN